MDMFEAASFHLKRFAQSAKGSEWNILATNMSARMFFLDFVVYPPLVLLCLYLAFAQWNPVQWLQSTVLVVAGLVLWTLIEYLVHRFAFHHLPFLKPIHMAHHDDPRGLNGTPTVATLAVFLLLVYWPASGLVSRALAAAWTAGLMAGYLAYVTVHYVVHNHGSGGSSHLRRLIRMHAVHHHETSCNFGVTTAIWDRAFGTLKRRQG